jgi:hypothetical protein
MEIEKYLGQHVSAMLRESPFKDWPFVKRVENDLEEPIILYVFKGHGFELQCDQNYKISVIFLTSAQDNDSDETLFNFTFSWKREQVLRHFGTPSKSGGRMTDPILGEYGGWDRFDRLDHTIHIEYRTDKDRIKMITLMRSDVVP